MKLKIKALSRSYEGIEKLINDYFYSKSYYLKIIKDEKGSMEFAIDNYKGNIPFDINKEYKVKWKKGIYYFYKVVDDSD